MGITEWAGLQKVWKSGRSFPRMLSSRPNQRPLTTSSLWQLCTRA